MARVVCEEQPISKLYLGTSLLCGNTYRRVGREAQIHQPGDALHVRYEHRRRLQHVHQVAAAVGRTGRRRRRCAAAVAHHVVLAAHERPAVHLEVRQIGGGQHTAQLQQLGRFQLHVAPVVEVVLVERRVHAGQGAQLLAGMAERTECYKRAVWKHGCRDVINGGF